MDNLSEKFLNEKLNKAESKEFEDLLKSPEFMEVAYLNLILKKSFQDKDNIDFMRTLQKVEQIHHYQQRYTLEELLAYFAPIQEYEQNLSQVSRANDLNVVYPQNNVNCIDSLYFEWNSPSSLPLQLIVENNEYDVLLRREIPSNTQSFSIPLLKEKGFRPGRYYWKLSAKRHQISAMGVFFIGKDLKPSNPIH